MGTRTTWRWARHVGFLLAGVTAMAPASPVAAQGWEPDARSVGLGGIGSSQNVFTSAVEAGRGEWNFVVPLGLLQLALDRQSINPKSSAFDPVRALEYGADPMHFVFGRDSSAPGGRFVTDVRNGRLSLDLNAYQGFRLVDFRSGGLVSPRWGYTWTAQRRESGEPVHGLYFGGGPNLAMQTAVSVDTGLQKLLGGLTPLYLPNEQMAIANRSSGQAAMAGTVGYRGQGRFGGNDTGGGGAAFLAVNVNYLHGLRYEDIDLRLRLNTDASGLLSSAPQVGSGGPLAFTRLNSRHGSGFSLDLGTGITAGALQFGLSANGLANRIVWRDLEQREYTLGRVTGGTSAFQITRPTSLGNRRVATPVTYTGNVAFSSRHFSIQMQASRNWNRTWLQGGFEQQASFLQIRGAVSHDGELLLPSAGASVRIRGRLWADAAAFATAANAERRREIALALSLRLTSGSSSPSEGQ